MKFFAALLGHSERDAELEREKEASEERINYLLGELRNKQQALKSGSRRLRTMSRTMALLRDGIGEQHDE